MKLHGVLRRDTRTDAKYCVHSGVSLAFLSQVGVVTARYSHLRLVWLADADAAIRPKSRGRAFLSTVDITCNACIAEVFVLCI